MAEVFGLSRPEMGSDWYRLLTCAEQPGSLATNAGLKVEVEVGLEALSDAATIVVPGWQLNGDPPSDQLRQALLVAHERGARLVSICSGALLLAAVGLRDGHRATIHWRYAERLQAAYPPVEVDAAILYDR